MLERLMLAKVKEEYPDYQNAKCIGIHRLLEGDRSWGDIELRR
jgi:hypothetical protein